VAPLFSKFWHELSHGSAAPRMQELRYSRPRARTNNHGGHALVDPICSGSRSLRTNVVSRWWPSRPARQDEIPVEWAALLAPTRPMRSETSCSRRESPAGGSAPGGAGLEQSRGITNLVWCRIQKRTIRRPVDNGRRPDGPDKLRRCREAAPSEVDACPGGGLALLRRLRRCPPFYRLRPP